jgi:hypothetical protein
MSGTLREIRLDELIGGSASRTRPPYCAFTQAAMSSMTV